MRGRPRRRPLHITSTGARPALAHKRTEVVAPALADGCECQRIAVDLPGEPGGCIGVLAPSLTLVVVVGPRPDSAASLEESGPEIRDVDECALTVRILDPPTRRVDRESPRS